MFSLSYSFEGKKTAANKLELANALNCDVSTVSRMLNEPGNPGRELGNVYDIEKWREYFSARGDVPANAADSGDIDGARRRERIAKAQLAEINVAKARGELLSGELEALQKFAARLREVARQTFTVSAVNSLASKLGLSVDQTFMATDILEKAFDDFCHEISEKTEAFCARGNAIAGNSTHETF